MVVGARKRRKERLLNNIRTTDETHEFNLVECLVTRAMATEEDEVRELLMRHRKQIIRDLNESKLLTVLTEKGVLSASNEKLFNDIHVENRNLFGLNKVSTPSIIDSCGGGVDGSVINNGASDTFKNRFDNENDIDEKKCSFLIDAIARNGYEKFKKFAFAIENECPQLIEDLINDQCNRNGK